MGVMATTTTTNSTAPFARRTCPPGWVADTGAEWSEDFQHWVVPVYMPVR
jgi:hypothetical protein